MGSVRPACNMDTLFVLAIATIPAVIEYSRTPQRYLSRYCLVTIAGTWIPTSKSFLIPVLPPCEYETPRLWSGIPYQLVSSLFLL